MCELSLKGFTYMFLIAILIWSSNFEECIARRGKHWRQNREEIASLLKKKGKNHGNGHSHNGGGSKSKSPPPQKSIPSLSPPLPPPQEEVTPSTPPPQTYIGGSSTTFNVLDFGAKGDGRSDDTKVN